MRGRVADAAAARRLCMRRAGLDRSQTALRQLRFGRLRAPGWCGLGLHILAESCSRAQPWRMHLGQLPELESDMEIDGSLCEGHGLSVESPTLDLQMR
eukprot:254192-Chlamydomonas_euryale.AAC.1